jgi:dienelactone hydrolase
MRGGKFPAVILAHGVGGVSAEREYAWAKRLKSWGIAAVVIDSFTGRGIKPPIYAGTPGFTHVAAHIVDAYLALQLISTHPKVDGTRVAVMGFSRGGELAVNAVFERFRVGAIGAAPHRFAAYIPFYPYCNFRHVSKSLATAPMLMLLAGADEQNEAAPCERLGAWLKDRGIPIRVVTYAGAHHGFDRLRPVAFDRKFVGVRECEAEYDLDTFAIRRLDTGAPLATREIMDSWVRDCRHKGGRFGGDARSREASIAEVRAFLLSVFRP